MGLSVSVLAGSVSGLAWADSHWWGPHMWGWGWGMALVGFLFMVGIVALVVWLIVTLVRQPQSRSAGGRRTALDLLDERYARGEIGRDEYLERRADLERS